MSYVVKENEGSFDILEKETDTIIQLRADEKRARDMCRKMNLGSGFNGWTPSFLTISYNNKN
jgi:hypothetical protein